MKATLAIVTTLLACACSQYQHGDLAQQLIPTASSGYPVSGITETPDHGFFWAPDMLTAAPSGNYNWMEANMDVLGDKKLSDITLPGTHDSGAYYLTKDLCPGAEDDKLEALVKLAEDLGLPIDQVITPWGLAQDKSFYQQLLGGIRYFDLRAGWDEKSDAWRTFHFEFGNELEILLKDVAKFMEDHTGEVVAIEVSHLDGHPKAEDKEKLTKLILDTVGDFMYPSTNGFEHTIEEMVKMNKRLVVSAEYSTGSPLFWPSSLFYNTYANKDHVDDMMAFNTQKVEEFNGGSHSGSLYKISWTLTPAADVIVESVLPGKPKSLKALADLGNNHLYTFWKAQQAKGYRMGNILIIDHFEHSPIVNVVKEMNGIAI